METKKKPLFIAFSSQKGGVGKSTFTALVASTLHYRMGYNVAVLDCDYPQHSLLKMRERDLKTVRENESFRKMAHKQFMNINKKAYTIEKCKAETALSEANDLIQSSTVPFDVIFCDLPGTDNSTGIPLVRRAVLPDLRISA